VAKVEEETTEITDFVNQKEVNVSLGLPEGACGTDSPLLDWSANPNIRTFHHMCRLVTIAHMCFEWCEFETPDTVKKVLDIGCASAELYHLLANLRSGKGSRLHYIGIEGDYRRRDRAFKYHRNLDIRLGDLSVGLSSLVPEDDFDFIVCTEVIEHVAFEDAVHLLEEIRCKLAPGGAFLLTTPNRNKYRRENPYHLYEYGHEELKTILELQRWEILDEFFIGSHLLDLEKEFGNKLDFPALRRRVPGTVLKSALLCGSTGSLQAYLLRPKPPCEHTKWALMDGNEVQLKCCECQMVREKTETGWVDTIVPLHYPAPSLQEIERGKTRTVVNVRETRALAAAPTKRLPVVWEREPEWLRLIWTVFRVEVSVSAEVFYSLKGNYWNPIKKQAITTEVQRLGVGVRVAITDLMRDRLIGYRVSVVPVPADRRGDLHGLEIQGRRGAKKGFETVWLSGPELLIVIGEQRHDTT
jgi:SAM-dependent methyltransferase